MSFPSFVTPPFQEFFRLGRVLRSTLPTAQGGVVHLFVVYGYQEAEEDADHLLLKLFLLKLRWFVLASQCLLLVT